MIAEDGCNSIYSHEGISCDNSSVTQLANRKLFLVVMKLNYTLCFFVQIQHATLGKYSFEPKNVCLTKECIVFHPNMAISNRIH